MAEMLGEISFESSLEDRHQQPVRPGQGQPCSLANRKAPSPEQASDSASSSVPGTGRNPCAIIRVVDLDVFWQLVESARSGVDSVTDPDRVAENLIAQLRRLATR